MVTRDERARRRANDRARHQRACGLFSWLLYLLGGCCAICGRDDDLTVDHMDGRGWDHRRIPFRDRVRRYWAEFVAGVRLRALCHACNSLDGSLRARGTTLDAEIAKECPF